MGQGKKNRAKRVLLLVHPHYHPERQAGTERDIFKSLIKLGHQVDVAPAMGDLHAFDRELARFNPHIVFNLLEEFRGEAVYDFHLVSLLEGLGIPFTGCNPRGLILSRNKYLSTKLAQSLGSQTPPTILVSDGVLIVPPRGWEFPLFVKLNREHASLGILETNRVQTVKQLRRTCDRLARSFASEILIQRFIPGSDVSVSVWGNDRPLSFRPRRLEMGGQDRVSTERLKFDLTYQKARSIKTAEFRESAKKRIQAESKFLFRQLDLNGYARFDFRIGEDQVPYLIDINANPNLARDEDFVISARSEGWKYIEVIERILNLGLAYEPRI